MSFQEAYEEFLIYVKKRHKKQGFETITKDFNSRIIPVFKNYLMCDFTKENITKWYEGIECHNFSNKYNSKLYSTLSKFIEYCISNNYLKHNYLTDIGNFKKHFEEDKHDFYNMKEFEQFISGFNENENIYKYYFSFMFFTGTRPSEAMALKFSDLNGEYVFINKTIMRHGNREFDTPKTNSSVRKILLDKKTHKDLLKLNLYYEKTYEKKEDYFIFGGINPLSPTSIDRYKLKACSKAKIRPITQHQFRHSHATLLIQKGMLINEISRRLGHSKVSTTLDIYTHTDFEQEKRVQRTLNSVRFDLKTITKDFKSILKHISMF